MKKALVVYGGWEGHEPEKVAEVYRKLLEEENFEVEVTGSLDAFSDEKKLMGKDVIIPHTGGNISAENLFPVLKAVAGGVGIAGCHAGLCDAFRDNVDWQFMAGGQWVAHPGGQKVKFKVTVTDHANPITDGIDDFYVTSEQYYLHVDPAVNVLATTRFPVGNAPFVYDGNVSLSSDFGIGTYNFDAKDAAQGPHVFNKVVDMPVAWTKTYGFGRVFYSSIGHIAKDFEQEQALTLLRRGILWACK